MCAAVPFYLIGAIPTGLLLARHAGVDITKHGSGNVGATNLTRVLGKKFGMLTLLIDVMKGSLAIILAYLLTNNNDFVAFAGFVAVCGHCFSIPGKFPGGKGVATALGVLLASNFYLALVAISSFLVIAAMFKVISLASVGSALITPAVALIAELPDAFQLSIAAIGLIIVFRHKGNLLRLSRGEEPRYSFTTSRESGPI